MTSDNETPATTSDDGKLPHDPAQQPTDGGKSDPGANGEDRDIIGKDQADLTAEDLEGR